MFEDAIFSQLCCVYLSFCNQRHCSKADNGVCGKPGASSAGSSICGTGRNGNSRVPGSVHLHTVCGISVWERGKIVLGNRGFQGKSCEDVGVPTRFVP